jgi:hypothetical protein
LDLSRDPPKNAEFPARTALAGPDMVCFFNLYLKCYFRGFML